MLAIRLQRTGRKGHAMFRVVVQDSRRTPTSGKVVAQLGTYDPHTKAVKIDNEKATFYVSNGAQPSHRATMLLKNEGVKLPDWVTAKAAKSSAIRHPEKLRRNLPKETPKEEVAPEVVAEAPAEPEAPKAEEVETAEESTPVESAPEAEAPADEAKSEA